MPKLGQQPVKLRSRGFRLWKRYESDFRRITIPEIATETGLKLSTVRSLVAESESDKDIYTNAVGPAYILARFFGATLSEMFEEI
jgi:hypothetical protein